MGDHDDRAVIYRVTGPQQTGDVDSVGGRPGTLLRDWRVAMHPPTRAAILRGTRALGSSSRRVTNDWRFRRPSARLR